MKLWARSQPVKEGRWASWVRAVIFWGVALLGTLGLTWWSPWLVLEEQSRDFLQARTSSGLTERSQVVLVDFSDNAIQTLGGWPINRNQMADLVEELLGPLKAKVVALDMVFPEPGDPVGDARLASLATHAPLVLAHALDLEPRAYPVNIGVLADQLHVPAELKQSWKAVDSSSHVANHPGFRQAQCVGHIAVRPDGDGVLRRMAPLANTRQGAVPMLAVAMLNCGTREAATDHLASATPQESYWRIPFAIPDTSFDAVEATDILNGLVDPARIEGRYVLVGSSALGLSDYVATPLHARTPGVQVHAQALADILTHGLPQPNTQGQVWTWAMLAIGCVLLWLVWHIHKLTAWVVWLGLTALWWGLLYGLYKVYVFPAVLMPPMVWALALSGITLWQFKVLRDTQQRTLQALSLYVAKPVLDELCQQGLGRSLTPRLSDITVLVVDMRGYTSMTDTLPLEAAARLTQDFLELITQPVLEHEGTLDRYSGDGLIAFWGAPLARNDHAQAALACVQALRTRLSTWNQTRRELGRPPIQMRMGVESGTALVGDLGSSTRSVYTAVGSCINIASRLQEMGRDLDCDLVIGPNAAALLPLPLLHLADTHIRGLTGSCAVYTLPDSRQSREA